MPYEDEEKEYKKELKEFFRKRLKYTYYEIARKTNNKCKQPSIFEIAASSNFLENVKKCIINYSSGLKKLAPYGKDVLALSFEAILLENKDYQQLYKEDEIKEILEVCKFALKQEGYFD